MRAMTLTILDSPASWIAFKGVSRKNKGCLLHELGSYTLAISEELCASRDKYKQYGEPLRLKSFSIIQRAVRSPYGGPVPLTGPSALLAEPSVPLTGPSSPYGPL